METEEDPDRFLLDISEQELVVLIEASLSRPPLALKFGPGWTAVETDKCSWALPIIQELRGITVAEGAGI